MAREPEFCALPPRHASRSNIAAVRARHHFLVSMLPSSRPGGGNRFVVWDGRPSNTFSDHEAAVSSRCGKANTKTPRKFARLDPVFARDRSGCSVFSIKEESIRLATSSPFFKWPNGKEPLRETHCCHLPEPRSRRRPQGLRALLLTLARYPTWFRLRLPQRHRKKIRHCATGQ